MNEEKVKRLEDKLDRVEMSLLESKKQAEKYMDRVLNTNDDLKLKFDQQYTNEMQDLKERYTKDLETSNQPKLVCQPNPVNSNEVQLSRLCI